MPPWLSIVIPLYNCEHYISMCLDSVLQQGLEESEYEVIVVNDGSTDNGASIVAEYCQSHANFRLINKENGGVSSARNCGMDKARGGYLYFMDADDRLIPNGLRTLYDCYLRGKPHPDMVIFRAYTVDKYYDAEKRERICPHEALFYGSFLDYVNMYGFGWGIYCRLTSCEFLIRNGIRFEPFSFCQDLLFIYTSLSIETGTILATSLSIYRYYVREDGASNTRNNKRLEKQYYDLMNLCKRIEQLSYNSKYKKALFEYEINSYRELAFKRLVYGGNNISKLRAMLQKAKEENFFPIEPCTTRWHKVINIFVKSPLAIYLLSIPTRYVFLPYIKPHLHRN